MKKLVVFAVLAAAASPSLAREELSNAEYFNQELARTASKPAVTVAPRVAATPVLLSLGHSRSRSNGAPQRHAPSGAGATLASWYGGGEALARHTASGEVFRPNGLTAAHRTLPLGTRIRVSANGRSVVVRVNDRGPAAWTGRSLDLSKGAARALGMIGAGTARVSWHTA